MFHSLALLLGELPITGKTLSNANYIKSIRSAFTDEHQQLIWMMGSLTLDLHEMKCDPPKNPFFSLVELHFKK